jgi:hypothetical protein
VPAGFLVLKTRGARPGSREVGTIGLGTPVDTRRQAVSAPLRKLSGEPDCKNGNCPTLWGTTDGREYVVQEYVIHDPERLAQLDLPERETAVMVSAPAGKPVRLPCCSWLAVS